MSVNAQKIPDDRKKKVSLLSENPNRVKIPIDLATKHIIEKNKNALQKLKNFI
ncbi:hypothetical protein WD019_13045 [Fictibacillus sp. Mic-4]|uniref:hypothetical protein n=1 Tax=Fictibacillus TaxID=1329200 RepID=UPI00041C449B|nr:hypothetical protein [Fictibacillus gelatini]